MKRRLPLVGPTVPEMLTSVPPPPAPTLPAGARIRVGRTIDFAAAHQLPNVPAEHKCARMHGHNYTAAIEVTGPIDEALGWVTDFGVLTVTLEAVVYQALDHRCLNEIPGLENPTSEVLACWIWQRVSVCMCVPGITLASVRVSENGRSWAVIEAG